MLTSFQSAKLLEYLSDVSSIFCERFGNWNHITFFKLICSYCKWPAYNIDDCPPRLVRWGRAGGGGRFGWSSGPGLVAYVWCEMVWTQKSTELPQVDEFLEFVSVCGITNIPQMGPASRESCWLYSGLASVGCSMRSLWATLKVLIDPVSMSCKLPEIYHSQLTQIHLQKVAIHFFCGTYKRNAYILSVFPVFRVETGQTAATGQLEVNMIQT